MNISNKLKRVKAQADHLFLRGERTDVVGQLRTAEYQAEGLRLLCDSLKAAIERTITTHNTPEDKRMKKLTENNGSEILKDALSQITSNVNADIATSSKQLMLWDMIENTVECQQALNTELIAHDALIEKEVLTDLNKLIKEDFASYAKMKKLLKQYGQDLDTARNRYRNSTLQTSSAPSIKADTYKEEMDEAETRLEQCRDNYACELYSLLAKERFICNLVVRFTTIRQDFFIQSQGTFNKMLPKLRERISDSTAGPVFGYCLNEHLMVSRRTLALPIEVCVKRLVEVGLLEEGLFRIAGSASKVKRLKAAFDANMIDDSTFSSGSSDEYNRDYDVHVIAGVLKSYLRELKEPLLTYTMHTEFLEAARVQDRDDCLRKLWSAVNRLPPPNYENFSYFMQFLTLLTEYQQYNKMTPNNIAIVIAPNLIWSPEESKADDVMGTLGRNMSLGNHYRHMVELIVENSEYFFKKRYKFDVPKITIPPPSETSTSGLPSHNGTAVAAVPSAHAGGGVSGPTMHRRNKSADLNKLDMSGHMGNFDPKILMEQDSPKQPLRRKKQAPLPPQGTKVIDQGTGNSSSSSPEQSRSQLVPTREAPTPLQNRMYPPIPSVANARDAPLSGMSKSTPSSENLFNASNASSNPPVPAARVYGTVRSGSVRKPNRPSAEPPKPPVVTYNRNQESKSPVGGVVSGSSTAISGSSAATTSSFSMGVENGHSNGAENNPNDGGNSAVSSSNIGTSSSTLLRSPSSVGSTSSSGADSSGAAQSKPPRPTPPTLSSLEKSSSAALLLQGESTADVLASEVTRSKLAASSSTSVPTPATTSSSIVPSATITSESSVVSSIKPAETKGIPLAIKAPIGFEHLHEGDASSDSITLRNKPNQVDGDSSESSLVVAKVFKKSLENVIQNQASGQPVALPRHADAADDNSSDTHLELAADGDGDEQVVKSALPPVPAARTFKENLQTSTCERPEPAPRVDKPALPDKPMTLPRPQPSDRPPLAPRPSSNPNVKYPVNSSASTAGASSTSEENLFSSSAQPCESSSASTVPTRAEEDGQASPVLRSSDKTGGFNRKAAVFGGSRTVSSGGIKTKLAVTRKLTPHMHVPAADPLLLESAAAEPLTSDSNSAVISYTNTSIEGIRASGSPSDITVTTGDGDTDCSTSLTTNMKASPAGSVTVKSSDVALPGLEGDVRMSPCPAAEAPPIRVQDRVSALVKRSSEGSLSHKSSNSSISKIASSNQDANSNNNNSSRCISYGGLPPCVSNNNGNPPTSAANGVSVARSISCDPAQRQPGVRTSIHALQAQIFGGTTLEPSGGQILIRRKGDTGGQGRLPHSTPETAEEAGNFPIEAKAPPSAEQDDNSLKGETSFSKNFTSVAEKAFNSNRFPQAGRKLTAVSRFVHEPLAPTGDDALEGSQQAKNRSTSRSMDELDQISESNSAPINRNSVFTKSVHGVVAVSSLAGGKSSLQGKNDKNSNTSSSGKHAQGDGLMLESGADSDLEIVDEVSQF